MVYGYLLMGAFLVGTAVWGAKYYSETGGPYIPTPQSVATETIWAEPIDGDEGSGDKEPGGGDKESGDGDKELGGGNKEPGGGDKEPGGGDKKPGGGDKKPGGGDKKPGGDDENLGGDDDKNPPSTTSAPSTSTTRTTTTKKIRGNKAGYVGNGWWSSNMYFGWEPNSYPGLAWGTGIKPPKRPSVSSAASFDTLESPPPLSESSTDWLENLQKIFVEGSQTGQKDKGFAGWHFGQSTTQTTTIEPDENVSDYDPVVVTVSKDHLKPPPGGWGVDYNPYFYFNG